MRTQHFCFICLAALGLAAAGALAAPSISSTSGTFSHGNSVTVSGSGFGAKATAAPIKWDDFADGTNGATLSSVDPSWVAYAYGGAIYSNTESHSGSLAAYNNPFIHEFATNYFMYTPTDEVFVAYWVNITNAESSDYGVIKLTRITSSPAAGGGGVYNGLGDSVYSNINPRYGASGGIWCNPGGGAGEDPLGYLSLQYDTWLRVDMYKKVGTPGVTDGAFDVTTVGIDSQIHHGIMTRASGETFLQDAIILGLMSANSEGQFELYIDDVYIDNTCARVEIGNAATWSGCTHKEIQIPSSWSSGSITVTVNTGSFGVGSPAWVYVVDSTGAANSAGYPVTFAGGLHLTVNSGSGDGDYYAGQVVAVAADAAPSGLIFDRWTGYTAGIANVLASSTTLTMPGADAAITATYATGYNLTVNSGDGGGTYVAGRVVTIVGNTPPSGYVFAGWVGDTAYLGDPTLRTTTVTMPATAVQVTAAYAIPAVYSLTVNSGTGGGAYIAGAVVAVAANAAPTGTVFCKWVGNTSGLADQYAPGTNLTMPAANVVITVIYQPITLIADYGNPGGTPSVAHVLPFENWTTIYLGSYTSYTTSGSVSGPAGGNTGTFNCVAVSGTTAHTFPAGDVIIVTWHNPNSSSRTLAPKVSFTDPDMYGQGTGGTWYDMTGLTIPAGQSRTSTYTVTPASAGSYNRVNVCRYTTIGSGAMPILDKVELGHLPSYSLTVNSGTGGGTYTQGTVVDIQADAAPSGMAFDRWTGNTANVANVNASSTTLTMPAAAVSVTATYVPVYQLTVNSGTGDGQYKAGTVVAIQADAAASGMEFDEWTGDTAGVADPSTAATTVTMPASDAEVTATYSAVVPPLLGDLNGDGFVGQGDLNIVLSQWGRGAPPHDPITDPRADANHDNFVGQGDLNIVLADWGKGTLP